ncbi:hypothetical protein [uncultured Slackia sp.]|uniref:hypothetical protein n=1 Tax=Slackia isoflavoniconvertens TaxID=572010 RepID=UPI00267591C6|nr:hypothetical protein [uncultured Slackia sp.]
MNETQRREQLKKIIEESEPISTGVALRYQGETKRVCVYRIPLDFLVYNKYNGRISSRVKAYERLNHELNSENDEDRELIEKLLWESKVERNRKTMEDLVENGQMRHGIVTADGVIIDGNRRASLLNRAYRERDKHKWSPVDVDKCRYFNAIILPQDAGPRDIQQLETTYQMGEDDKLDYNPIEKYLKVRDLTDVGFDIDEIAKMMNESTADIKKWQRTLVLMDEYLETLGYEDMYPMLDRVEDQFLSLSKGLKDWQDRSVLAKANWEYSDADIDDLKVIAFDYIRYEQEGKEFRRICKPGKEGSIFQDRLIWESFRDTHFETMDAIAEESVDEEIAHAHADIDVVDVLRARDSKWKSEISDSFKNNLKYSVRRLDDRMEDAKPKEILKKVRDLLKEIDTEQDSFLNDEGVATLVSEINRMTYRLKRELGQ